MKSVKSTSQLTNGVYLVEVQNGKLKSVKDASEVKGEPTSRKTTTAGTKSSFRSGSPKEVPINEVIGYAIYSPKENDNRPLGEVTTYRVGIVSAAPAKTGNIKYRIGFTTNKKGEQYEGFVVCMPGWYVWASQNRLSNIEMIATTPAEIVAV